MKLNVFEVENDLFIALYWKILRAYFGQRALEQKSRTEKTENMHFGHDWRWREAEDNLSLALFVRLTIKFSMSLQPQRPFGFIFLMSIFVFTPFAKDS